MRAVTSSMTAWDKLLAPIQPAFDYVGDYPAIKATIILILALIVASLIAAIITRIITHFVKHTSIHWDDELIAALRKPLFWSVILAGIIMSVQILRFPQTVSDITQSLIATLLIFIWSAFTVKIIRIVLRAMSTSAYGQSLVRVQTRPLFENLGFILVLGFAIYLIFRVWHIDMTAWLASAGIVGIAIGFAAKDTLANLFSGVFILADAPYKIGDYVVLDSGERGKVTDIGIRSTRLLTRDDVEVTIPNAIMGNTRIVNESGGPYEKYRIRVNVGVAYGTDIDQVRKILMDIALAEPQACVKPEPRVRFREFGDSSLNFQLHCWVDNPEQRGRVLDVLNSAIYKQFNSEGIEIPYTKRDIYIKELPKFEK